MKFHRGPKVYRKFYRIFTKSDEIILFCFQFTRIYKNNIFTMEIFTSYTTGFGDKDFVVVVVSNVFERENLLFFFLV